MEEQKRKYQRFPIELTASFIGCGYTESTRCVVSEISARGIVLNLSLERELEPGKNLLLEIDVPQEETSVSAVANLKWVKKADGEGDHNYRAGVKLTLIKDEGMQKLMDYAYQSILEKENKPDS